MLKSEFTKFCEKIIEAEPFSFSRFGDGEFHAVLGHEGENCDKHQYFPYMGKRLGEILKSLPPYVVGIQKFALDKMGDEIAAWMKANGIESEMGRYVNADMLHNASSDGKLQQFFDALEYVNTIVVGPFYLHEISRKIDYASFVSVPRVNAWKEHNDILKRIQVHIVKADKPTCILLCCGPMGKVLVDELYWFTQGKAFVLDCGSVFDPYVGKATRRYHKGVMERLNANPI